MNKLKKVIDCPCCYGSGDRTNGSCSNCKGSGTITTTIDQTKLAKKNVKLQFESSINKAYTKLNIDMNNIENNIKLNKKNKTKTKTKTKT
jgi:hypothetical protein